MAGSVIASRGLPGLQHLMIRNSGAVRVAVPFKDVDAWDKSVFTRYARA